MANILEWIKNLWNLNQILSDYADILVKNGAEIYALKRHVERLEKELKASSLFGCSGIVIDRMAEKMAEAKISAMKEEVTVKEDTKQTDDQNSPSVSELPRITKRNTYYDPQMGVEYYDFEINGDKASPDEDTVKE